MKQMYRCRSRSKTIFTYLFMILKNITKYASHLDPWKMMSSNVAKWRHYIAMSQHCVTCVHSGIFVNSHRFFQAILTTWSTRVFIMYITVVCSRGFLTWHEKHKIPGSRHVYQPASSYVTFSIVKCSGSVLLMPEVCKRNVVSWWKT